MIARENYILNLLEGNSKSFFIPVYQREYSWDENYCRRLIQDLDFSIEHNLESHFFGSIVYTNKELGGVSSYCIIDGQQRLITISLLLLAIYNEVSERQKENLNENYDEIVPITEIKNSYFYVNPFKNNPELKIKLTDEDNKYFYDLFKNKQFTTGNKIGINYSFFKNCVKDKTINYIFDLYNMIKHLAIVNVSLEPNDNPQRIFESLNSKILPLLESDKIRNFIFMNVNYEDQKVLYSDYWKNIAKNVDDISKLCRFYLAVKNNGFVNKDQLYFSFKDYVISHPELTSKVVLKELLKYSEYMKGICEYNKNSLYKYQRSLYRLNKLDMSTIYPLVFICFDKRNDCISDDDLDEILNCVESYIVRRTFLKLSTGSLNKIFAFLPGEISKLLEGGCSFKDAVIQSLCNKSANSRFPKDAEFKNAFITFELYNAKSPFRKYVLERLENHNHKELVDVDNDITMGKLTIEHIMPQTLNDSWKNYLGDKWESIHQQYLDTIGNLTLTAYNSEYSNLSFSEKKELPEKGFKYSNLYLNSFVKEQKEWREAQINERAQKLLNRALVIWQYPSITLDTMIFDILKPETWQNIKITQFGREAFQYMFEHELLSEEEIELLKDKAYCHKVLNAYYPVLSDNREKAPTGKYHFAKNVYSYKGKMVYLSIEWFKEQFDSLSKYLFDHMHD